MGKPKPSRAVSSSRTRVLVLTAAALLSLVLFIFHPLPSLSKMDALSPVSNPNENVFSLLVKVQFKDGAAKEEFLQLIRPLVVYIRQHEPTTIGYEVLMSDQDDLQALIMERYADKENAYLTIHKSSKPFLEFRPKLQAMQEAGKLTVSGNSYLDSGMGFVGRMA